jgi:hypothetical protein
MCIGEIVPNTAIPVGQQAAAIVTTTDGNGTIAISPIPLIFQVRVLYIGNSFATSYLWGEKKVRIIFFHRKNSSYLQNKKD